MSESRSRRSRSAVSREGPAPLTPEQTAAWVGTYGRYSRIYAWGFFVLVSAAILGLIWWEMGELNADVVYSFGFAALIFFLLASWSRRATGRSWVGVVEDMSTKKVRLRRDGNQHDDIAHRALARVRTGGGETITLRLTQQLCAYFSTGDRIFKVSGLDWPEKAELDGPERVCLACGGLYGRGEGQCPRCRAPEPDHETLLRLAG